MLKKIIMFAVGMVFAAAVGYAATAEAPNTGQTVCYYATGAVIACSGTGQDGALQRGVAWPDPRFTAGAGAEVECVTDNLTGLMWTKNANLPAGTKTWQQALDYADGLDLCGHTDWRLPNVNELESLVHAGYNEVICAAPSTYCATNADWLINTQGFSNVQVDNYWSSTTYAGGTGDAWRVYMYGGVYTALKSLFYYVWPVRSGQ